MWWLIALLALVSADEKEVSYRKYIGERDYNFPLLVQATTPLSLGQTIHVVGSIKEQPKRIDFNFQKGNADTSDLPLHFAIRFDETSFFNKKGYLVYNTFENGNWSEEQRIKNPFLKGEEFDLRVRILNGTYDVFANRKHVGVFQQRQDLKGISHVNIKGDLAKLRLFRYGGYLIQTPQSNQAKLTPGKRLDISGFNTGKRFDINLFRKDKQAALSLSFRPKEGAVVRNAMENHAWGKEEREGKYPLAKDEVFDVTIINESYSFQIFVNGKRFGTFAHRGKPEDVETMEIVGDVELHNVSINDKP